MTPKPKTRKAPAADPIFKLIEKHRVAHEHVNSFLGRCTANDPEWPKTVDREWDLWKQLARTTPKTIDGLSAFVEYVASYPELEDEANESGAFEALVSIAEAFRNLALDPQLNKAAKEEAA
jgi:hypothetical protein